MSSHQAKGLSELLLSKGNKDIFVQESSWVVSIVANLKVN